MSPFLRLARARSLCLLHPLSRIHTEDQPHRHLVAIRQLKNYARDLSRIAFRTAFEAAQHFEVRPHGVLVFREQLRRILTSAARPVGANSSGLKRADFYAEWRDFQRERIAETADGPFGGVIWSIAWNREATADRRYLKDVAALLLTHHRHSGSRCVHHSVKTRVHDGLEILTTHLLERRNLPVTSIVD